jgi:hypothetical protein
VELFTDLIVRSDLDAVGTRDDMNLDLLAR